MKAYVYRAVIEPGDERDWVASFPDVPEAVTQAESAEAARASAQEALGLALLSYPARGKPLPEKRADLTVPACESPQAFYADVAVAPDVTAKLALLEAFGGSGRSRGDLAARLGESPAVVDGLLDPFEPTSLPLLSSALEALGRRLIYGVTAIDEAA